VSILRFPYVRYLVSAPRSRHAKYAFRPVIPVRLSQGSRHVVFDALIDSGADECTFPGWVAKTLGLRIAAGEKKIFSGIGGSVLSYRHRAALRVDRTRFVADVCFSQDRDDMPFGLLGQAGFFAHFAVSLNYTQREILLTKV
jgi:hypothetical protein